MVDRLDHLVLTVRDSQATCDFYQHVLGMEIITFGEGRKALRFGQQKINLHPAGNEYEPKAVHPTPGSADMCLITSLPMPEVLAHLANCDVKPLFPPARRTGATHPLESLYFCDPDGNLIEVSNIVEE